MKVYKKAVIYMAHHVPKLANTKLYLNWFSVSQIHCPLPKAIYKINQAQNILYTLAVSLSQQFKEY